MFWQLLFASVISSLGILASLVLIPFMFFGLRLHHYSDSNLVTKIEHNIVKNALILSNNTDPMNFSYGKWYIAYVGVTVSQYGGSSSYVYVFCSEKMKAKLLESEDSPRKAQTENFYKIKELKIMHGSPYNKYQYGEKTSKISKISPDSRQEFILKQVLNYYSEHERNRVIVYIDGKPKSGKSSIAHLLYLELSKTRSIILLENYQPLLCNNMFESVLEGRTKSNAEHLIVTIEEVDCLLRDLNNTNFGYKFRQEIYNKSTWDAFMDAIDKKGFKLILLLTSNTMLEHMPDPSYLRDGRTHLRFRLNEHDVCQLD